MIWLQNNAEKFHNERPYLEYDKDINRDWKMKKGKKIRKTTWTDRCRWRYWRRETLELKDFVHFPLERRVFNQIKWICVVRIWKRGREREEREREREREREKERERERERKRDREIEREMMMMLKDIRILRIEILRQCKLCKVGQSFFVWLLLYSIVVISVLTTRHWKEMENKWKKSDFFAERKYSEDIWIQMIFESIWGPQLACFLGYKPRQN